MKLTAEQIQRGIEKLIEDLPEYEFADDLLIAATRHAVGPHQWIENIDDREEMKRDIYRGLKQLGGVKIEEDRLTREDLDLLSKAHDLIQEAIESLTGLDHSSIDRLEEARTNVSKAMEQ